MLYIALAAAAGLIGLDQLTKILIDSNMQLHQSIPIISFGDTNVLNITYERNPGAAFSILEGKQLFLILFTAVVIVVMLYLMLSKRVKKPTYIWSMSLIVAGGIGNLIDRVIRGEVVDFIDVRIINFAVFNRFLFPGGMEGYFFALFSIAISAAETAIAIAIMINIYRNLRSIQVRNLDELKW